MVRLRCHIVWKKMIIAVLAKEYCFKLSFYTFLVFRQMFFLIFIFMFQWNMQFWSAYIHNPDFNSQFSKLFIWKSNFIEKINIQSYNHRNLNSMHLSARKELNFDYFYEKKIFCWEWIGLSSIHQWQWSINMQLCMCILHMHNKSLLLLIAQNQ